MSYSRGPSEEEETEREEVSQKDQNVEEKVGTGRLGKRNKEEM